MSFFLILSNMALLTLSAAILVIVAMLGLQIAFAGSRTREAPIQTGNRPPVAVLVPAHNEAASIEHTLISVREQLCPSDRLIVIAHNCSDETASIATRANAEIVEHHDLGHVGKGYALDAGFAYLEANNPPEIVIFVDADCSLSPGSIEALARYCVAKNRPVQGIYLMNISPNANSGQRLSAFAWRIKNKVRPLGLHALGMPCLLTGAGMAIPSRVLRQIDLATNHITEDMLMSVTWALAGYPPTLCPEAVISSDFAPTETGRNIQKSRWIHGHLSAIATFVPKLAFAAFRERDIALLVHAIDIAILPLGLFVPALIGLTLTCFTWFFATGYSAPLTLSIIALLISGATFILAWAKAGRDLVGIGELREIMRYMARQLSIAKNFATGHRSKWTRSERGQ